MGSPGVRRVAISPATRTDVGKRRSRNEDVVATDPSIGLYAVFDGMGGENAGDVAAKLAADEVVAYVLDRWRSAPPTRPGSPWWMPYLSASEQEVHRSRLLQDAIRAANKRVHEEAAKRREHKRMGTTAVVALVSPGGSVTIAHVGDSRAYLIRAGRLRRLTTDHTIVGQLVKNGKISEEEAKRNPWRHMLLSSVGTHPEVDTIDVLQVGLEGGDRLMLCSDGVNGEVEDAQIERILRLGSSADAASGLIRAALGAGGRDNASVVVLDVVAMGHQ